MKFEDLFRRYYNWRFKDELAAADARFEERLAADPERESHVQKVRLMILKNPEDPTAAALAIVDHFLPRPWPPLWPPPSSGSSSGSPPCLPPVTNRRPSSTARWMPGKRCSA